MNLTKGIVLVCFAVLLSVPMLFRPQQGPAAEDALRLIIITPHNEQIRYEFARAFDDWHQRLYGQPVNVVWSVPGGTSEMRRMLEAQFTAALKAGDPLGGTADLVFGGGSYVHTQLRQPLTVVVAGNQRSTTITIPVDFNDQWLGEVYGENVIGDRPLYDPQRYWFGTALSGFGIVFNRDVLSQLGVPEPVTWEDLCDPALDGSVALANPAQSGSITTTFETILQHRGWARGWQILRRSGANARYFSGGAPKAPIDVSLGDAAVGMCIDFFGRYQSQAIEAAGGHDRIGYIDPPGATTLDADPISILRGAPDPRLARRFIEFCLSEYGQSLWQLRVDDPVADGLGPTRFELRRMPIARSMYEAHLDRFIDRVNPYTLARPIAYPNPHVRAFIAPLFSAMVIDTHHDLCRAWEAIVAHPAYPATRRIVTAEEVDDPTLRRMLELFDAMPKGVAPDGTPLAMADDAHLAEIKKGWDTESLWPKHAEGKHLSRVRFARRFRENYRQIIRLGEGD